MALSSRALVAAQVGLLFALALSTQVQGLGRGWLLGLPLFAFLVGFPVWSALEFAGTGADALSIWSHAFLVGMTANVVDWLVLDELWLGVGKPSWALPPGAAWADALPFEHARHFADFLKGAIMFAVVAGLAVGTVMLVRPVSSAGVV